MPLFVLIGWDGAQGQALRKIHRQAHLDRLTPLDREKRVVAAGPLTDGLGSLLIIDFPNQAQAEQWMAGDPYVKAGIFVRTEVHPYTLVFPKP